MRHRNIQFWGGEVRGTEKFVFAAKHYLVSSSIILLGLNKKIGGTEGGSGFFTWLC